MRYESFYPFVNHQTAPPSPMQQPSYGRHPFMQTPPSSGQSPPFQMPNQAFQNNEPNPTGEQGPSKMDAYMQTANRFLNTAQQFAPVAQQFAPMLRNLPAMWRLYKGFQSIPSAGGAGAASAAGAASQAASNVARAATSQGPLPSVPRIFQPPS